MGSFGISEGNITGRKKKERKKETPQIACLTTTSSRELVQTLTIATSKRGASKTLWPSLAVAKNGGEGGGHGPSSSFNK